MPHYGSGVKKRRKRAPATAGEEGRKERREGGVKAERVGGGQRGREGGPGDRGSIPITLQMSSLPSRGSDFPIEQNPSMKACHNSLTAYITKC